MTPPRLAPPLLRCTLACAIACTLGGTLGGALASCKQGPTEPSVGTNSNWLRACVTDEECSGAPSCECGACTLPCARDADCDGLQDARCVAGASPSASQSCGGGGAGVDDGGASSGLCLPRCEPGTCRDGQACVSGGCVLAVLPDNAFCAPVAEAPIVERTREEELLGLLAEARAAGGVVCGGTAAASPAPVLRLDARLTCAARVLAQDLEMTRALSPLDSQGRTTDTRVRAAGFQPSQWAEALAIQATSAAQARDLMLADPTTCMQLISASYAALGVGSAGDVLVVTLGAP